MQKVSFEIKINPKSKNLHSEIHSLAKDISEWAGEPKKFGLYLGVIKNIGLSRAYQIFSEMKQMKKIDNRAKLFLYLSKKDSG